MSDDSYYDDETHEVSGVADDGEIDYGPPKEKRGKPARARARRWPALLATGCVGTLIACCVAACCLPVTVAIYFASTETTRSGSDRIALATDEPVTLIVNAPNGSVTIRPTSANEVAVTWTAKAYNLTSGLAQDALDNITVNVAYDENTNTASIDADTQTDGEGFWGFIGSIGNSVDLEIAVPGSPHLQVEGNVGSINVRDVTVRSLDLRANTGSVDFGGRLALGEAGPFAIQTNTGSINVSLPRSAYARLDASTDTGSITVSGQFNTRDVSSERSGPRESWSGVLGSGEGEPPILRLQTDTGSIDVKAR